VIAHGDVRDALADGLNDACAFVPRDDGHGVLRRAGDEVPVAVAHADRGEADEHFGWPGRVELELFDAEGLVGRVQHGGADLHVPARKRELRRSFNYGEVAARRHPERSEGSRASERLRSFAALRMTEVEARSSVLS
jgi:hypothetical protein